MSADTVIAQPGSRIIRTALTVPGWPLRNRVVVDRWGIPGDSTPIPVCLCASRWWHGLWESQAGERWL